MNHIREDIIKIVDDGDRKEMEELSDMLREVIEIVFNYNENKGKEYELKIYVMAWGKRLTDDMKRQWVEEMNPPAKWNEETVRRIIDDYGVEMPPLSAYVIINMMYSDLRKALGEGEDEESLRRYIQATKDWYYDLDATNTEEAKLYCYWKNIVK